MNTCKLAASALARNIRNKNLKVTEALDAYFLSLEEKDGDINAYISLNKDEAYRRADEVQHAIDCGDLLSPLAGVPIAVKDNICTKGLRTTCASKMLADFVPAYDAEVISRLNNAGMIIIGKTNMDEFAMGSTSENSFFGAVRNPHDLSRSAGGSSGGSCAAVASGEAAIALGSDTGGSVRQPSSHCGVVGFKPAYGTVSRYGLISYGSSLEQVGIVAKNVEDCTAFLNIISGKDEKDMTTSYGVHIVFTSLSKNIKGLKIGLPTEYLKDGLDGDVRNAVFKVANVFKCLGASVEEFSLELTEYAVPAYYVLVSAEASSNLEKFDGVRYGFKADGFENLDDMYIKTRSQGFGSEVKRRIMLGSFVLSEGCYETYYLKAMSVRNMIRESFNDVFEKFDIILSPVAPTTAPKLGAFDDDPIKMYMSDVYTVSANLAGIPAISMPCGTDKNNLPIGVQLMAARHCEDKLFKAAYALECALEEKNCER